jgi:hypothetical protein
MRLSKIPITKKDGGEAQDEDLEFKPQYHQKQNNNKKNPLVLSVTLKCTIAIVLYTRQFSPWQ